MSKANFLYYGSILICLYISGFDCTLYAQISSFEEYRRKAQQQFEEFKAAKQSEFEAYRARINKEFADFMSKGWPEFNAEPAIPAPSIPEPPTPKVAPPEEKPLNEPFPFSKISPIEETPEKPTPLLPEPEETSPTPQTPTPSSEPAKPIPEKEPETPILPSKSFEFYGQKCEVPFDNSLRFSLRGVDEKNVAQAWQGLSGDKSVATVKGCVNLRDNMRLSDWGYIRLLENFSNSVFPNNRNEARLLQMFLLTQSGYKVRIGRSGEDLILLVPCKETIYNYKYIPIRGLNYYITDKNVGTGPTYIYNREFPGEQMSSLFISEQPQLPLIPSPTRHLRSAFNPSIDFDISVNKNLIDFYNDYPLSSNWNLNAKASLSEEAKSKLYPILRENINGKGEVEAAGILLHFVQTAFDYKTDEEQFGIERSFFPDENFYYPFNDCEDRAILFAVLVKDLIGLDTVLVHYPGHLATAVHFNENASGDYFDVDGQKYIVCDPTYINAGVGQAMSMYKGSNAELIKL